MGKKRQRSISTQTLTDELQPDRRREPPPLIELEALDVTAAVEDPAVQDQLAVPEVLERNSNASRITTAGSPGDTAADSADSARSARRALVWFRRDLRLHDNLALSAAIRAQEQLEKTGGGEMLLLPIYILHRPVHQRCGPVRFQFLLESIQDLANSIADTQGRLVVLRGEAEEVLSVVMAAWGITDLFFEDAVMPYGVARDSRVRSIAASLDVKVTSLRGVTLYDSHEIVRRNGGRPVTDYERLLEIIDEMPQPAQPLPAPVKLFHAAEFTSDQLYDLLKSACGNNLRQAKAIAGVDSGLFAVPPLTALGLTPQSPHTFIYGGESAAIQALDAFCDDRQRVGLFQKPATSPVAVDAPSTTSLSPYLTFGCLSAREFFYRIMFIQLQFPLRPGPTQVTLEGQLMWREFFYCYACNVPNFDSQELNPLCRQIDWRLCNEDHVSRPELDSQATHTDDADEKLALHQLQCWKEGRTGFPWIDAIMHQINQEGWTHHAGRHAAACFLTRGVLYISWLRGAAYFQEKLIDMDWPLNIGNWLWVSASTFFCDFRRVSSPSTFPQRWDVHGRFIRKYIPALREMPDKFIFEPWKAPLKVQRTAHCLIGKDYPFPIVDSKLAIERCIAGMSHAYADTDAAPTTNSAASANADGVFAPGSPNDMVYSYHTSDASLARSEVSASVVL